MAKQLLDDTEDEESPLAPTAKITITWIR